MQHECMLRVHFKPGGTFPFLGALANKLTNAHADLADLGGRSALELRERFVRRRHASGMIGGLNISFNGRWSSTILLTVYGCIR